MSPTQTFCIRPSQNCLSTLHNMMSRTDDQVASTPN